ncbi:hypothetical protein F6R98_16715 [Candidatus Methylospira mobilis]|uniref:Uncharacterized protein n=1 Tax=Candidatus Methylospira mobilis TaxID=1808979 RepID=A0A5Q0BJT2_9GAMM|nr:hypothetical protein [Candidatus Methylospira mobilis]QFY44070.1 hypothetical protein F6R98_16715 [Candidatus Methylospira mobilis]WNV05075.1 hypothetical protein RP726_01375 [Candidatus Methylospira mobilis]
MIWLESEVENWRRLISFAIAVFGIVVVFVSLQDIIGNAKFILSFANRLWCKKERTSIDVLP